MNKNFFSLLLLFSALSGCASAPNYNYQSQNSTDPDITFGDRSWGDSTAMRAFKINTSARTSNLCKDYFLVGHVLKNQFSTKPPIHIKTPFGKSVAIYGYYLNHPVSCEPPILMFTPKDGSSYTVDIETTLKTCAVSIYEKLPSGQLNKVNEMSIVPSCND